MKTYREFCNAEGICGSSIESKRKYYTYLSNYYSAFALQGYLSSYAGATKDPDPTEAALCAITYASALAAKVIVNLFPDNKDIFPED